MQAEIFDFHTTVDDESLNQQWPPPSILVYSAALHYNDNSGSIKKA